MNPQGLTRNCANGKFISGSSACCGKGTADFSITMYVHKGIIIKNCAFDE